jgi:hypothetical protein
MPPLRDAIRSAFVWWIGTRVVVLAAGYLAVVLIGFVPLPRGGAPTGPIYDDALLNLPARWDALWYVDIAGHGYRWTGDAARYQNVVFFPGYPVLVGVIARAFDLPPLWAGVLLSQLAFFVALVYLHRLVRLRFGASSAGHTVALLAAYPFSVFHGLVYTESLFLLAAVAAFYDMQRGRRAAACAWAVAAGFTRVQGLALAAPLALLALRTEPTERSSRAARPVVSSRMWAVALAAAPFAGVLVFSAYLMQRTGRPVVWMEGQRAWGPPVYARLLGMSPTKSGTSVDEPATPSDTLVQIGNVAAFAATAMAVPSISANIGAAEALFVIGGIAPSLAGHLFQSMGRFTCVLFPLFIALALALRTDRRVYTVAAMFFVAEIVAAAWFFTWRHLV